MSLLLVLLACSPEPPDPWTDISALCDTEQVDPWRSGPPDVLDPACEQQLVLDFGVDGGAFAQTDDLDAVLKALWVLAATRQGRRSRVVTNGFVSHDLVTLLDDEAAQLPDEDPQVARLFYNRAAAVISEVAPTDEPEPGFAARYLRASETVFLAPEAFDEPPESIAGLLAHEVAHDRSGAHVPCPWDPTFVACDDDITGAYGIAAGWFSLAVEPLLDDPFAADRVEAKAWESRARVIP